ncbi:hypothetical protein [Phyllobacterium lublinensis]|uniref:hypothetical protein n=1 Tax=Phyllobacterium lublinensis TaxID=2875708 RepID=UPI001CCC39A5|nr:hypothetical protein [Phyllobacterium sp. 2063]MBZ9657225.1 hypothetical protein [Phyllobacterium sp. 2063]
MRNTARNAKKFTVTAVTSAARSLFIVSSASSVAFAGEAKAKDLLCRCAEARVGRPLTPVDVAGVAWRTVSTDGDSQCP